MEPRERFRPDPAGPEPTLHEIQRAIERMGREDRAMLRPWILARYDVRGYRSMGYSRPPEPGAGR
ncbi:MAG TPA: hypothetical protein VGX96_16870 [Candidatus Elarobacter sp.]|jgi:hypothetical protein|nr:hypothetical protein [Candidatus Elarobacter sp.]